MQQSLLRSGLSGLKSQQAQESELKPNPVREQAMQDSRIRVEDGRSRDRMEATWGPNLDALSDAELQQLARRTLSPFVFEYWTRSPKSALVREELLDAIAYEQSFGRAME